MVSSTMDLIIKLTSSLSIMLSKEFSGKFSTDDNGTLYKTFTRNIIFQGLRNALVEVVKEVLKQLRFKSSRVFLDTSLGGHEYNTRRKQKGLLPSTYNRLVLKQRRLTNVLRKAYIWLCLLNLIPPELRNVTAEQVNKIVRNINEVYVVDNKELFELFF